VKPPFYLIAALALLLAGCATAPVELTGYCSLDDPASEWVVANKLERQAEAHCRSAYRVLERTEARVGLGKEFRWVVACG